MLASVPHPSIGVAGDSLAVGPVPPAQDGVAAAARGSLSPSRAADFMACPLRYRFRVIDRLPEPPSQLATRGTLVHAVLERLFDLPAGERTLTAAEALVQPEWQRLLADDAELGNLFAADHVYAGDDADTGVRPDRGDLDQTTWLNSARTLLAAYFSLEDPQRLEPAGREERVECLAADGLLLRGIIDRIDVAPTGAVRLVDYKTGRAPGETFEARALFQMKFYALVVWRTRGVIPACLQLVYLADRQVLRYAPTEADLLATERKLAALWAAVERALCAGDFRPNPGPLCAYCHHQALCPAYGGTPPPMPSIPAVAGAPVPPPDEPDLLGVDG